MKTEAAVPKRITSVAILLCLLLLRVLVGFQPHSGQDNYHGKENAYGGDYEAQRHWMELTLHLPVGDWYWYDLEYWGLDYPPLTAYVSWVCGFLSDRLISPETVALDASRGLEDPVHKAYMRATVLLLDAIVYMPIVILSFKEKKKWHWVLALAQPALILMDHGHFQYNSVSLGLALWSFWFVTMQDFSNCLIGSIFFCLALNFKQMTLYYAPAIFCYLLGRCFVTNKFRFQRFLLLGATVVATFAALWWPFVCYGPPNTTPTQRLLQVVHRIFPFQRGLFEGKVSNLWCALSTKPFSIRERVPPTMQPLAALGLTLLLVLPACYKLFLVGHGGTSKNNNDDKRLFLWGAASTGLAFFLASFQVHEKSILVPLAPISLLEHDNEWFVTCFSLVAAWSLWPLVCIDRLQVAYVCTIAIFLSLSSWRKPTTACIVVMLGLHAAELMVTPPPGLPDIFPLMWSIAGCAMFCLAWIVTCYHLLCSTWTTTEHPSCPVVQDRKQNQS